MNKLIIIFIILLSFLYYERSARIVLSKNLKNSLDLILKGDKNTGAKMLVESVPNQALYVEEYINAGNLLANTLSKSEENARILNLFAQATLEQNPYNIFAILFKVKMGLLTNTKASAVSASTDLDKDLINLLVAANELSGALIGVNILKSVIYIRQHKLQDTYLELTQAKVKNPNDPRSYCFLADYYILSGNINIASEEMVSCLKYGLILDAEFGEYLMLSQNIDNTIYNLKNNDELKRMTTLFRFDPAKVNIINFVNRFKKANP